MANGRSDIELEPLTTDSFASFKRINTVVLPTRYSESWYKESLQVGDFAQLAFIGGKAVGAIRCALELSGPNNAQVIPQRIYVMTLAVLAPYRKKGVGSALLEHIVEVARAHMVHEIYVHVWVQNKAAIEWYLKMGFVTGKLLKNYYTMMDPQQDAYVMTLTV